MSMILFGLTIIVLCMQVYLLSETLATYRYLHKHVENEKKAEQADETN